MNKLTDAQLLAAIAAAEETALGVVNGQVSTDRADAVSRYYGKPYGDEVPGRSQVVSRDVADVVEGVVANVVKPFVGGDEVVRFNPIGPEDEKAAEQETDYVNFVALERNNGFIWLVSAIKDALLLRSGYIKGQWEVRTDQVTETYVGMTDEELALLVQDEVEVIQHTGYPDPVAQAAAMMQPPADPAMAMMHGQQPGAQMPPPVPMLHDVKVKKIRPTEYVRIYPVPPDEILVGQTTREPSLQDTDFVQHRPMVTISWLRQAGYKVDDYISDDDSGETEEELARQRFGTSGDIYDDDVNDPSRRQVRFKETYIRIDKDGDGVAELRRVCSVGQNILSDEECDIVPIAAFAGVLVSHQHLGMSVYDLVEDLAKIKTALIRSYLDNRYLQNNGRYAVNSDSVNLDDFLVSRPGGVVRVMGNPAESVMPLIAPDTSTGALQGLEYLDSIREQRTGYTRNSAGIDNNALTNRTMGGMAMQLSQSQLRLEMIARTIAETGARDVFRIIHALTLKHSTKAEKVQLKGKWATVNPREWVRRTDLSITIGLGTGTPEQQLAKLMGLAPLMQQGQMLGLVGVTEAYNFAVEAFKLSGYKSSDRFIHAPPIDPKTGQPQQPPQQPPPEVQVAQMKMQSDQQALQAKMQGEAQKFQAEAQFKRQELQMQAALKQKEQEAALIVQQQNDQRDAQAQALKAQMDAAQAERDHQLEMHKIAVEDARERERMMLEAQLKREEMQISAQAAVQSAQVKGEAVVRAGATKAKPEGGDPELKQALKGLVDSHSKPRKAKRNPDGSWDIRPA